MAGNNQTSNAANVKRLSYLNRKGAQKQDGSNRSGICAPFPLPETPVKYVATISLYFEHRDTETQSYIVLCVSVSLPLPETPVKYVAYNQFIL